MLTNSHSIEETNKILHGEGLPTYDDSFTITFRVKKKHFFTVEFGDVKAHRQQPYFSTSGTILNYNRSGYNSGGQCQERILSKGSRLEKFYQKWDKLHTKPLTMEQFKELKADLAWLKSNYAYIDNDRFSSIVEFDRKMSK